MIRVRPAALPIGLALTLGACSVAFTHGPPPGHEKVPAFNCTTSNVGPILDIIVGSAYLIGSVASAANEGDPYYAKSNQGVLLLTGVVGAVVLGVTSAIGFEKTAKCRAAKAELAARQATERDREGPGRTTVATTIDSVVVGPGTDTLAVGATVQLTARTYGPGGLLAPDASSFAWSSSNDAIASVTNDGLVSAHAHGVAVISAVVNGVVAKSLVVVRASP